MRRPGRAPTGLNLRRRRIQALQMEHPITILSSIVALLLAPGPTDALLAASGVTSGTARSASLLVATIAGYITAIMSIRYVIGPTLISSHPVVLRTAACAYLMYLTVKLWKTHPEIGSNTTISFGRMYLTTLLNPKAAIAALVILPFGSPHELAYLVTFALLIPLTGAAWILAGTLFGRYFFRGKAHFIPRVTSAALGLFAVALIVSALE